MNATPVLEGYGVRLVPLRMEHMETLRSTHDESTWTWMNESGATPELLRAYVERAVAAAENGSALVWTTTVLHAGGEPEIAGCTRLADLDTQHRRAEIGWTWVAPRYRGQGLNPRVKLLQLEYAFGTLGLRRVALKTHHANLRSQGAMLKLGAQYEGTFRNHMFQPDGSSRDTKWYSILDSEWPGVRSRLLMRLLAEPLAGQSHPADAGSD